MHGVRFKLFFHILNNWYVFQISVSEKDYQLPPIELLRQRKIYRRPTPKYNYIMLDKSSPDKCQKTTDNPKVRQVP
jgi:hypothetical protein